MITNQHIKEILKERTDRLEYLINQGKFEDAISIGEEFDEWIRDIYLIIYEPNTSRTSRLMESATH